MKKYTREEYRKYLTNYSKFIGMTGSINKESDYFFWLLYEYFTHE